MRAPAVAALIALLIAGACAPEATPSPSGSVAPPTTPAPTASATPRPAGTVFTSAELGYRVVLPAGWRRTTCTSAVVTRAPLLASDEFTSVSEMDERGTDTGVQQRVAAVEVRDAAGATAASWLRQGGLGYATGTRVEETTFDGRPAARLVASDTGEVLSYVEVVRDRVYATELRGPIAGADVELRARSIAASLHVLDDAELAALRVAPTPSPAPRSADEASAALADGFARRDLTVIASVLAACVTTAAESAGASFQTKGRYLEMLRASFAAGLTVIVTAQPDARTGATRYVRSVWTTPGRGPQAIDLMLRADGDRWEWFGTLARLPAS